MRWSDVDYMGMVGEHMINIIASYDGEDEAALKDPMACKALIYKQVQPEVPDKLFVLRWSVGRPIDYDTTDVQMVKNAVETMMKVEQSQ